MGYSRIFTASECHRLVTCAACQNIVAAACEWDATELKLTSRVRATQTHHHDRQLDRKG